MTTSGAKSIPVFEGTLYNITGTGLFSATLTNYNEIVKCETPEKICLNITAQGHNVQEVPLWCDMMSHCLLDMKCLSHKKVNKLIILRWKPYVLFHVCFVLTRIT